MKKVVIAIFALALGSCAQLMEVANQVNLPIGGTSGVLSNLDIANGLKQALNKGVDQQVTKLTAAKGFYNNPLVKIALPAELQKVDQTLRKLGLSSLADKGLIALNDTASDAVKTATPIFVNAISNMSFSDAKNILMGQDNAATQYLEGTTNSSLYQSFNPVIKKSFDKVGAADIWTKLITRYNSIPLVSKVNPDITDYVTQQALTGVFKMIAVEEKEIRTNLNERSTGLLQKVFALQDRK